jgi:hypothetical protein
MSGDYDADLDSTLYTINVGLTYKF